MKNLSRFRSFIVMVTLVLAPGLSAQDTAPKPITFPSPHYPAELVDTGTNCMATVDVLVGADGSVSDPKLDSADNPAFGTEAMAVIGEWKFEPGTRDGSPIAMRVQIPFRFRAPFEQLINAVANRKVFVALPEPAMTRKEYRSRLKVKQKARPVYPKTLAESGVSQKIKVNFVVTPEGTVVNPQVLGKPNLQLIVPAIAAVSQMTYEPPKKGDKGVFVEATITMRFEEPLPPNRGEGGGGGGRRGGGGGR